jgi:hypothetical protein
MPRRSAASLTVLPVTPRSPRPTPPSFLSKIETALFAEAAAASGHLTKADTPMLACWAQTMAKAHRLARTSDTAAWERAVKLAMSLSRALRLTPQATVRPETAWRRRNNPPPAGPAPWEPREDRLLPKEQEE